MADGYGLIVGYCEFDQMSVQIWETQILGTAAGDSGMAVYAFATGNGPSLNFLRSRGATIGTQTIVQAGDSLGEISWYGSDGNDMANPGATIEVVSSGTPASNDMPASMVFSTNRTTTTVTEAMRIEHYGLVGIGTTVPDGRLHVFTGSAGSVSAASNADELIIENSDHTGISILTPAAKSGYLQFGDVDDNDIAGIEYSHYSDSMRFYTNTAERVRIDSSGNVGIGTTLTGWDSLFTVLQIGGNTAWATQPAAAAGNGLHIISNANYDTDESWEYISTGCAARLQIQEGAFRFYNAGLGTGGNDISWNERMRINSVGSVGIGTATPLNCTLLAIYRDDLNAGTQKGGLITLSQNGYVCAYLIESCSAIYIESPTDATAMYIGTDSVGCGAYIQSTEQAVSWSTRPLLLNPLGAKVGIGTLNPTENLHVQGNACVTGSVAKGSGSFRIEHPLESKKDTHDLVHSFIEGPQADLIYRGVIELTDGSAQINVDTASGMTEGTFVALNRCVQAFTNNESNWDNVRGSVTGNTLTIESNDSASTASISWMVIGERCDEHMMDTDWTDDDGKVIVEPIGREEPEEPEEPEE